MNFLKLKNQFNLCSEKPLSVFRILLIGIILSNVTNQTKVKDLRNEDKSKTKKVTKTLTKRSTQVVPKPSSIITYESGYYDMCTRMSFAGYLIKDFCSNMSYEKDLTFGCSDTVLNNLKNYKEDSPSKKFIKLVTDKSLPFGVYEDMIVKTNCVNGKDPDPRLLRFDLKYKITLNADNLALVKLKTALRRDNYKGFDKDTEFYENSVDVFSFTPCGNEISLKIALEQYNLSFQLLNKKVFAQKKIALFNQNTDDFIMKKAALYLSEFIDFLDAYHQLIYICAIDWANNRALHFLVDRRSFSMALNTQVRFILYHISSDCNNPEDLPEKKKFNFNLIVLKQGAKTHLNLTILDEYLENTDPNKGPFEPESPLLMDIPSDRSSFSEFYVAVQRYRIRYRKYNILNNCQHFATGMFEHLTKYNVPYVNKKIMTSVPLYDVSKDPFNVFFQKMTDEEFRVKAKIMIKNNN